MCQGLQNLTIKPYSNLRIACISYSFKFEVVSKIEAPGRAGCSMFLLHRPPANRLLISTVRVPLRY